MTEYIERKEAIKALRDNVTEMESDIYYGSNMGIPEDEIEDIVNEIPAADVVEIVRCKDCKHETELDKHCELNRTAYKHCNLWRGDETRNVWHKYKKYYKDYSVVEPDDFCSYGERESDNDN